VLSLSLSTLKHRSPSVLSDVGKSPLFLLVAQPLLSLASAIAQALPLAALLVLLLVFLLEGVQQFRK
jgi:hypothetical protein